MTKITVVDHISHSQLGKWQRCPRSWKYHYIDKIEEPKSANLALGIAYHYALEQNYVHKIQNKEDLPVADCLDAFSDSFSEIAEEVGAVDWGDSSPTEVKCTGLELVLLYRTKIAPDIVPMSVEAPLEGNILGVKFTGRVDLITEDGTVVDHKTAKQSYNQDKVDHEMQPCAYAFGLGRAIEFAYHVAVKKKASDTQILYTKRTMEDVAWWLAMVEMDLMQMQSGIAPPRPDGWHCSPKACGYWEKCRQEMARSIFDTGGK